MHPNELLYLTNPQKPGKVKQKEQNLPIILLSIFLGISLLVNIFLALVSTRVIDFAPATANKSYTTYNSPTDLDSKAYQGELVQFRADPFDLTAIKGKSNEYMWRFSKADGKDYGIVLRFPLTLKPVATGIGLYSGKALSREVYGESKVLVIQIEGVKG
jgi:hypothetical protein